MYKNKRNAYNILVRRPDDNHVEELDVIGENILKWILSKPEGRVWSGLIWLRILDKWRALVNTVMYTKFG